MNKFTSLCITFAVNTTKKYNTMAQTSMTVRLDKQQKTLFDDLCSQFGMSANTAINIFVRAVIRSKSIPFQIAVEEDNVRANAISAFNRMRSASSTNQELSLDEINAEINEVRANK
jgi:DNA-damage-inducible protein J